MTVYGITLRIHPLFLVVLALAAYGRFVAQIVVLFAIVIAHELGHVIAAKRYGYRTESIELLPFGGVARLSTGKLGFNPRHETIIAIWGPLINFLLAFCALLLHVLARVPEPMISGFITMNLTIMFFNLLPGLPLDGGRIARAGLAMTRGYEPATKAVIRMSFYLSATLMCFGLFSLWFGYADMGLLALGFFLLFSAYTLSRQSKYDTLRFLDAKRRETAVATQPLTSLAVLPHATVGEVASRFAPGVYHVIYIRANANAQMDAIEEKELLHAIFEQGMWTEPISQLLS